MAVEHYGPRAMMFRNGAHMVDLLYFFAGVEPRWVTPKLEPGLDHFAATGRRRPRPGPGPVRHRFDRLRNPHIRGIFCAYKTEFNARDPEHYL